MTGFLIFRVCKRYRENINNNETSRFKRIPKTNNKKKKKTIGSVIAVFITNIAYVHNLYFSVFFVL